MFVLVISVGVSRPTNRRVSEILAVDMQRDFSKEAAAFSKQKCIAPEASSYESRKTDGERDLNTQDNVFHLQFGHVWKRFDSSLMGSCKLDGKYRHDKSFQHRNQTPQNLFAIFGKVHGTVPHLYPS